MWGLYPLTGRVHLISSFRICWGMYGNSIFSVDMVMSSPLAIFVFIWV